MIKVKIKTGNDTAYLQGEDLGVLFDMLEYASRRPEGEECFIDVEDTNVKNRYLNLYCDGWDWGLSVEEKK